MTKPHPNNACGGGFSDWLEVHLLPECNGSCSWCVEARGYHPTERVSWAAICAQAIKTGKSNVILLGGEPTLHPNLSDVIGLLNHRGRNVYLTTNGSRLTREFVEHNLFNLTGINISLHSVNLPTNEGITGIPLHFLTLQNAVDGLHVNGVLVRLNCNLIAGATDSHDDIVRYIEFAKALRADSVRFAELKFDDDNFVDAHAITGDRYGLNDDPFACGCNTDTEIDGMPVNFRQMCGFQTAKRPAPLDPEFSDKGGVLYYNGEVYPGWQCAGNLSEEARQRVLQEVADGLTDPCTVAHLFV